MSSESEATKPCPFCGETILAVARKCRFCRSYLDPTLAAENATGVGNRPPVPSAADRMLLPVGRPFAAIAAGYLGLIAIFPFVGIPFGFFGVIYGIVALKKINQNPELSGKGRAWFGIIAGGIGFIVWTVIFALAMLADSQRGSF